MIGRAKGEGSVREQVIKGNASRRTDELTGIGAKLASVIVRNPDERKVGAGVLDQIGKLRLRETADSFRHFGEVAQIPRNGACVGRDRHGAEDGARIPTDDELGGVVHVQQNEVARLSASGAESSR